MENDKTQNSTKTPSIKVRTAREICYIALSVALIAVTAWISVPLPSGINITLQLLGVCLVAGLLGVRRSVIAVVAYILLGLVGVPVFSGFTGGMGKLSSPAFGYIVGFVFTAISVGIFSFISNRFENAWKKCLFLMIGCIVGVILCYAFGTAWFILYMGRNGKTVGLIAALTTCVVPYIPFDIAKSAISVALVVKLKKFIK